MGLFIDLKVANKLNTSGIPTKFESEKCGSNAGISNTMNGKVHGFFPPSLKKKQETILAEN